MTVGELVVSSALQRKESRGRLSHSQHLYMALSYRSTQPKLGLLMDRCTSQCESLCCMRTGLHFSLDYGEALADDQIYEVRVHSSTCLACFTGRQHRITHQGMSSPL